MRVYLSGQAPFGAAVLTLLRDRGDEVVGVSAPKRHPSGSMDPLWADASLAGIPCLEPGHVTADVIRAMQVDLIVCAHSHEFIDADTRAAARLGALGYHPSLLPRHRGRDAIRWAIRMREPITGGTVYWLTDQADAGPIAAQAFCFVRPEDDARALWRRELFPMGLRLLAQALADLDAGHRIAIAQDETLATWEPAFARASFQEQAGR